MSPNSTPTAFANQEQPTHLVTNDYRSLCEWINACPSADTLTAYSLTLQRRIYLQLRCKRWSCPHCGPRRIAHITRKVCDAKPNKFVTLTINNNLYETPREAYDRTRRHVGTLSRTIRKTAGEWEYCRVLEITKRGWPHYHLVVRGHYVEQHWLSAEWDKLTGAHIVDIRRIKNMRHAAAYVMKYLYKQKAISWTNRRMCWSRNFFAPNKDPPPEKLCLIEPERLGSSPPSFFANYFAGRQIERLGPDMWAEL